MILAYKGNIASANIGGALEVLGVEVHWLEEPALDLKKLPEAKEYIVVYSHRSEKGVPSLTVHSTGNFHTADIGGKPETLQLTNPVTNAEILLRLSANAPQGFAVTYEATHHGPTGLHAPLCFVELGSSEVEWSDIQAVHAVALSVKEYVLKPKTRGWKCAIGIGGTHYAERFTRRTLKEGIAFGHIIPAHALSKLKPEVAEQLLTKTTKVDLAILDTSRQGLQEERKVILDILEARKIELKRLK